MSYNYCVGRFTFYKPHRIFLHYAYAITAALISFLLNIRINLFYRTTIAVLTLIICMLTSYKKKTTIQSVYMFAISAFVNIIICFLLDNSIFYRYMLFYLCHNLRIYKISEFSGKIIKKIFYKSENIGDSYYSIITGNSYVCSGFRFYC